MYFWKDLLALRFFYYNFLKELSKIYICYLISAYFYYSVFLIA